MDISKGRYWDKPLSWVDGCTPCSPGCDHCWSAGMTHRFNKTGDCLTYRRPDGKIAFCGCIKTRPDRLDIPLKRRKPTVYAVWNDWVHEDVPFEFIAQVLDVACDARCEEHTILLLTKRPHRWDDFKWWHSECWSGDTPFSVAYEALGHLPDNVWFGLTVCNQAEADDKIPIFLQVPGKKFLSIEPMLSVIDPLPLCTKQCTAGFYRNIGACDECTEGKIDAVILGGETGAGARPMHPDWVRSIRDQCQSAGVSFFLKYMNKKDGRILDGRTHDDLPWRNYAV